MVGRYEGGPGEDRPLFILNSTNKQHESENKNYRR